MKRLPIVAGNWKMNATVAEAAALTQAVLQGFRSSSDELELVLCPPFTALSGVGQLLRGSRIALGAQNMHWEPGGAYTGEVSPTMLKDLGCRYVILGHSERRLHFGESDALIRKKVLAASASGLRAILCVGETLKQRQAGQTWQVVRGQLEGALEGIPGTDVDGWLVIAYEPVWAIGTGQNATPSQAQEAHAQIRGWLSSRFGKEAGLRIRIQYGGSVKADNAAELMAQGDVDGALVGGASLDAGVFLSIAEQTVKMKRSACCSTG